MLWTNSKVFSNYTYIGEDTKTVDESRSTCGRIQAYSCCVCAWGGGGVHETKEWMKEQS